MRSAAQKSTPKGVLQRVKKPFDTLNRLLGRETEEALSKRWFSSASKSLPLEGKVAQRERSRMRWISKSINFYGSDERIAFASLNTSSVNYR
jgi:hypothetical protein